MHANPLQRAKKLTGFFVKSVSFLHFLSGFVFAGFYYPHIFRTDSAQAMKTRESRKGVFMASIRENKKDGKLQYITPAITSNWNIQKITMET